MENDDFMLLLHLARKGGIASQIETSTSRIASELSISQQTASRKIRKLAASQLISSTASSNGITVSFTEKGKRMLHGKYLELESVFSGKKTNAFEGKVVGGKGEGKYFLSFKQYTDKINERLGFMPFPGTLNLSASQEKISQFSASLEKIYIEGFELPGRTFGGLHAIKVLINNEIPGALIFPERSNLPGNIAELIAPLNLRKKFSLKDGSKVRVGGAQ